VAVIRSMTEAVQSRVGVVQGARDSFNTLAPPWRPFAPVRDLADVDDRPGVSLDSIASFESDDLLADYRHLVDRLRQAGFDRVIAVDLSRPDFGIAVVRVRVPGLTSFAVNRRRAGWRCLRYLL
jgi:ribosomal protein S12 methylthiotransferase accessory factor